VKPSLLMISLSSQGLTGPEKDYRSFGPRSKRPRTSSLTGIRGASYISSLAYPDLLAACQGRLMIAGLRTAVDRQGLQIDFPSERRPRVSSERP